jgi:hypothetical protein
VVRGTPSRPKNCPSKEYRTCKLTLVRSDLTGDANEGTPPLSVFDPALDPPAGWFRWISFNDADNGAGCSVKDGIVFLYPDGGLWFKVVVGTPSPANTLTVLNLGFVDEFGHSVGEVVPPHTSAPGDPNPTIIPRYFVFSSQIPGASASLVQTIRTGGYQFSC